MKAAFSRFYGLMAAMAGLMAKAFESGQHMSEAAALAQLGGYKSRGHGRGIHSGRKPNRNQSTDWLRRAKHGGGAREVAHRQRQLSAGTLRTN